MSNQIEKKIRNNVYNYYGKIKKGLKSNFITSLKEKRNSSGFSRLTNKKYKNWIENLEKIKNNNKKNTNFLETVKVIDEHVKKKYKKKGCQKKNSTKKVCKKYNKICKVSKTLLSNKEEILEDTIKKIINSNKINKIKKATKIQSIFRGWLDRLKINKKKVNKIEKNGLEELNFKKDFIVVDSMRTFVIYKPLKIIFYRSSGTSNPGKNFPNTFFPCFQGNDITEKNLEEHDKWIPKCYPKGQWLENFFKFFNYIIYSLPYGGKIVKNIHNKSDEKFTKYYDFLTKFCDWKEVQLSLSLGGAVWNSNGEKFYNDYTNNSNNNNRDRYDFSEFNFKQLKEFVKNYDYIYGIFIKRRNPINDISKKNNGINIRSNFRRLKRKKECTIM